MHPAPLAMMMTMGATGAPLDWLAGRWCTKDSAAQTCEAWSAPAGGIMLGTSQTVRDGKTTGYEFMRIALEGDKAVFHGSPDGAPAVAFVEAARDDRSIAFANAAHDYPQRIVYRRRGDVIEAEVSLADGSKAARWHYERANED